ncbi:cyclin N-terminal domain-containing protein 2 [Hypomesus transpacificus]|uniref:cyclin N-terminal domain-containing protein 2 n=1 Tax=Hypomesus transpacificus TaxID=137520 RepID=UPI001F0768F0|nr:cyclin N-terminal domain-containing protein 2 [Hypomesus transpacificus]
MLLLDLHKKTEERRAPLRTWANVCPPKQRCQQRQQPEGEEPRGSHCKSEPQHRWAKRFHTQNTNGNGRLHMFVSDGCAEEAVLVYLHGLQGLHSLRALVPGLLRCEIEQAMVKLGLIYDKSYAWDIFSDMMRSQLRYTFSSADLPQPFTHNTRAILVDWLIQVHDVFHFSEETLYLSIHLLNRALRQMKVSTSNLQLLGLVCLFLAGKKEESLLPEVSELCYLMENSYTKRQLLRMERRVLCELKFDLSHCPPLHFLLLTASVARCCAKVVCMARYLLELSLLEGQCVVFLPAQLAGASLCLARRVLQEPPTPEGETAWCIASSINMGSETTLLKIMHIQARAAARAHSRETRATFIKFSTAETMHVSSHPALQSDPSLLGLLSEHA